METIIKSRHHTEIECNTGVIAVNTVDGIQLHVEPHHEAGFGTFLDLRREEAQELVRVLTEALS